MIAKLCVVVPCKDEELQIPITVSVLRLLFDEFIDTDIISIDSRICFVDDGSFDETWPVIVHYSSKYPYIMGIKLPVNYGQLNALAIGLHETVDDFDCFLTLDCDLQDDVTIIETMVKSYYLGHDAVSGVRNNRDVDSFFKRFSAHVFYCMLKLKHADITFDSGEFRLYDKLLVRQMLNVWHDGYLPRVLFTKFVTNPVNVYYRRLARTTGVTKYDFKAMLKLAMCAFRMPRRHYVRGDFIWPVVTKRFRS